MGPFGLRNAGRVLTLTLALAGCAMPHHEAMHAGSGAAHAGHTAATEGAARALMRMWASGDTRGLDAITTADVVYDDVPNGTRFEGRAGIRRYIEHVHAWAGQVSIDVTAVHHGHDAALAEWVMRGVQDRPIPGRVPVATQRGFALRGATLVQLRDGRIRRAADYIDVLGFVLQLGSRVELPGGVVIPTIDTPAPAR